MAIQLLAQQLIEVNDKDITKGLYYSLYMGSKTILDYVR